MVRIYCACHTKSTWTRWKDTIWSHLRAAVTRRLASYRAKESFKKDGFCSFPHRHCNGTKKPATRAKTRWSIIKSISCETSLHFARRRFKNDHKIDVFLRVFLRPDLKIDVSCEASLDFHHMSQNATPATLRSADNAICRKHATWSCEMMQIYCACPTKSTDALKKHEKTRVGAISHSRDKAISVLGRKSRRPQKTPPRACPLGRELTSWQRRGHDDTTTRPRRHHDDTTTTRQTRREHRSNPQGTLRYAFRIYRTG